MGANTLIGNDVYNTKLEDLGDIKEIMLDIRTGRVSYAVVSFGGFLVRRPENTLNYFRVFCPECFVARRRHSPAMTFGPGPQQVAGVQAGARHAAQAAGFHPPFA